ncbi:potassium channel family protein [Streptomyces sp. NPDC059161]|uniref:potassium channel family protein n=1 Tax=Streptomyces sp. NPDC059161 TaxID=3346749 RepID=UPI003677C55A
MYYFSGHFGHKHLDQSDCEAQRHRGDRFAGGRHTGPCGAGRRNDPGSFSGPLTRTASLYFTLVTFSSVGYGDIVARSDAARIVTMVQMTGNLILLGVATRIAITAVQAGLRRDGTKHTDR